MSAPDPSISIIIPTRNEVENIAPLVSQIVTAAVPLHEIVFIDANSTDGTLDIIRSLAAIHPIRLIEQNAAAPGLAAAITAGAAAAKGELLLVMDADSSHPPERINDLLAPLRAGAADLVIGSRYIPGGSTPGWPIWRRMLSRAGSGLTYPLTGVHDCMCGFFAIERSRLLDVVGPAIGFKIAFEIIVRGRPALSIVEIPDCISGSYLRPIKNVFWNYVSIFLAMDPLRLSATLANLAGCQFPSRIIGQVLASR